MPSIFEIAKRQLTLNTHRIFSLPVVILMPHSSCNCRCVMCDIWMANQNKQQLTHADLAPHLKGLKKLNVRWIVLSGGEPLMHDNLWTLCELLKELGVKITLLSTGLLLRRFAAEVVQWCDEVIVSLDGSQAIHDQIRRVPRAFERLMDGVAALRELDATFRVTARCVLQQLNYFDLPNIVQAAHEMNLNQISFLAADVSTTAFNRPTAWEERIADVALTSAQVVEFEAIVERVIQEFRLDFESGYIAESPEKIRSLVRYYKALSSGGNSPEIRCNAPWVSTVIDSDGTVRPCFFHASYGNIQQQPLRDILNSKQAIEFRRRLDVSRDPICQKCVCSLDLGRRGEL